MQATNRQSRRLSHEEIGARIAAGEPVARLLVDDPTLTTEELREAVETYLAARATGS